MMQLTNVDSVVRGRGGIGPSEPAGMWIDKINEFLLSAGYIENIWSVRVNTALVQQNILGNLHIL